MVWGAEEKSGNPKLGQGHKSEAAAAAGYWEVWATWSPFLRCDLLFIYISIWISRLIDWICKFTILFELLAETFWLLSIQAVSETDYWAYSRRKWLFGGYGYRQWQVIVVILFQLELMIQLLILFSTHRQFNWCLKLSGSSLDFK